MIKAAKLGNARAQCALGICYATGDWGDFKGPKNAKIAAIWYEKSARQGYAEAQYNFGAMKLDGEGMKKDRRAGWRWIRKAAFLGEPTAIWLLKREGMKFKEMPELDCTDAWINEVKID